MEKHHRWLVRLVCALSILVLMFSFSGTLSVQAQDPLPPCDGRDCPADPGLSAQAMSTLKYYTKVTQKGFYVASGVAMANQGFGRIVSPALPPNSTVTKAYLFWGLIGPKSMTGVNYARGFINTHAITGTLVGTTKPQAWYGPYMYYAYRADVKAYVAPTGGGNYDLSGFASGSTAGGNPWSANYYYDLTYPFLDGASLVVIFSNPNYPTTTIQIYNGASTLSSGVQSHLTISGVNAVSPVGLSSTTFIAGEGVHTSPAASYFFERSLPAIVLSGHDHNGNNTADFSNGNFWDTQTLAIDTLVNPPENNFMFTVDKPSWAGVWVAQVLAYSSGAQDTDGDGLPDGWELHGFDANGDNDAEVYLPGLPASPGMSGSMFHKDLYVEADYGSKTYLPPLINLNDIVNTFNNAPVHNPDGVDGIHIHIDTGGYDYNNVYTPVYNLGGGQLISSLPVNLGTSSPDCMTYNWSDFQAIKTANFDPYRAPIFHYVVFANELSSCLAVNHTSGISRNGASDAVFIKGAMDFIVSLGGWGPNDFYAREGTFVHELGHNLGLRHGGNDHVNYKPNYVSVMNYLYQTFGVIRGGGVYFDYSRLALPALNELALYENNGLGTLALTNSYGARWICPDGNFLFSGASAAGYNWNCIGGIQTTAIKLDLNHSGTYSTLTSTQNNWASITLKGNGAVGNSALATGEVSAQGPATTIWVNELTKDQAAQGPPWPSQP